MELHGKSVFGGIAMGRLSVYHKTDNAVKRTKITDIEAEKKRFEDAKEEAKRQLGVFYEKAVREVGEVNAAIFEMHQMMLDDLDIVPHQWLDVLVSEYAFCLALINSGSRYMNVVESGNSLDNFSLHKSSYCLYSSWNCTSIVWSFKSFPFKSSQVTTILPLSERIPVFVRISPPVPKSAIVLPYQVCKTLP